MEKVFASVWFPLQLSDAVARTSQSPFPLAVMLTKTTNERETGVKKYN